MRSFRLVALPVLAGAVLASWVTVSAAPKPKYGPEATVLSQSHDYFRKHEAPEFWSLIPYYLPQQEGSWCSVASVAMFMNAVRSGLQMGQNGKPLTADDMLVTQSGLLKKVDDSGWNKDVGPGGHGVKLDELGKFVDEALKAYGIDGFNVEVVHTPDTSARTAEALHKALEPIAKSTRVYILANFIQGVYTGDADAGHIAPVGAYDAAAKRVLILDPDREWYEPYWVSEATFLAGMATSDRESGMSRGYVLISLK